MPRNESLGGLVLSGLVWRLTAERTQLGRAQWTSSWVSGSWLLQVIPWAHNPITQAQESSRSWLSAISPEHTISAMRTWALQVLHLDLLHCAVQDAVRDGGRHSLRLPEPELSSPQREPSLDHELREELRTQQLAPLRRHEVAGSCDAGERAQVAIVK